MTTPDRRAAGQARRRLKTDRLARQADDQHAGDLSPRRGGSEPNVHVRDQSGDLGSGSPARSSLAETASLPSEGSGAGRLAFRAVSTTSAWTEGASTGAPGAGFPGLGRSRRRQIGPYRLLAPVGAGGMGVVYRARDSTGRDVALKLVKLGDGPRQERFRREAEILARFNHPGILRVHGFGEVEGQAWIATEFLEEASPLDSGFRERTLAERVALIAEVSEALGVVHAAGVVHRDVKPENLLLTRDGRVRVTDFGISLAWDQDRLTQTGHLVGTAHYLSPEQLGGEHVGPQADVWALGVILYQAMTGRFPFESDSMLELFGRISSGNFPPPRSLAPDLPRGLEAICIRALSQAPGDRYAGGASLGEALRAWQAGKIAPSPWPGALVLGLTLVALLGLALLWWTSGESPEGVAPSVTLGLPAPTPAPVLEPSPSSVEVDPEFLREALPSDLVREALVLERRGELVGAGRCYAAAAAKRPREPFHGDWISGAAVGDPECVAVCLRELETSFAMGTSILEALARGAEAERMAAVEALGVLRCTPGSGAPLDFAAGLPYLRRTGTPRALGLRGRLGRLGIGGESRASALALLSAAAKAGDARAHRELALSALGRPLAEFDRALVLSHLRAAARGGDALARALLEEERGAQLPAADLIHRAESGEPMACIRVGLVLREGQMIPRHVLGAHDWIRRGGVSAEARGRIALELARLHADDLEDPAGALLWTRRALVPEALARSGQDLELGAINVGLDAITQLLIGDDAYLEKSIGDLLERGRRLRSVRGAWAEVMIHERGPRRDEVAGVEAIRWGAEIGQSDCMLLWARCLRKGRGGKQSYEEALNWARRAVDLRERAACTFVVFATYRGEGVAADPAKALALARRYHREQPGSDTAYGLGRVLIASERANDRAEGLQWLRRSAKAKGKGKARLTLQALVREVYGGEVRAPVPITKATE